jgi:hypothetical protein
MNLKVILSLSLVANLALAGGFFWAMKRQSAAPEAPEAVAVTAPDKKTEPAAPPVAETPVAVSPASPEKNSQAFDWRQVESEDYKKYIANLRSIGCPEETIRDIIVADVNKLFESRRKQLASGGKKFEYWKANSPFGGMFSDADLLEKQQALGKEKRALLTELLGSAPEEKFDMFAGMNPFESMLDFLSTEKQSKVMQLFQDMQVKMAKQMKSGSPDGDDMKVMQTAQKQMEAELAKILSPQEFEDYQLRMSQTAMTLRMQLSGFDPSEEEFRKVFFEKKKFDDEYSMFTAGTEDKEAREKRAAAQKELNAKLKEALGETRYADYERAKDWNYQTIAKIADRNNLGKDAAVKVYDMKKLAEAEAAKIRKDTALTSEQRTAALASIRTETESSIKGVLGDKGYKSYEGNAWWLKSISPDPKATATKE